MNIRKFLKDQDQYGPDVGFHFGNYLRKETGRAALYQTVFGGIMSIITTLGLFAIILYYGINLIANNVNKVTNSSI